MQCMGGELPRVYRDLGASLTLLELMVIKTSPHRIGDTVTP